MCQRLQSVSLKAVFFLFSLFLAFPCFSEETVEQIRVAVLEVREENAEVAPIAVFKLLDSSEAYHAERFFTLPADRLDDFDAMVLFQPERDVGLDPDEQDVLRKWVENGHGLLALYAAAGDDDSALFPEIARVSGYPCDAYEEHNLEEGVVAGESTLTEGYAPGYRYMLVAQEYAALAPGADGSVVLRSVTFADGKALSSEPLMVAGSAGKGRYAAYGPFYGSFPRIGLERNLIFRTIDWLSERGEAISVSGDIGEGADIGPQEIDFAVNGGAEEEPESEGGLPPGWRVEGNFSEYASLTTSTNAYSGKRSIRYTYPGLQEGEESAGQMYRLPYLINGELGGTDLHAMPPNSRYTISFRMMGGPENKTQPNLYMFFYTQIEGSDKIQGIPTQKVLSVPEKWGFFSFDYVPRLREVGQGCQIKFQIAPGRADHFNPDSVVYIDDLEITRSYGGVPKGVSFESILADCEEHISVEWSNALSEEQLMLNEIPAGVPIEYPEKELARPMYNPLPDGWKELDLSGDDWKIRKLPNTHDNPTNDVGTQEGVWKPDYDDSKWAVRTVPSHWHGDDEPDPEGRKGWGSRWKERALELHEGVGWYRHRFNVPADFKDERIILVFEGFDHEVTVFLNGENVGQGKGFFAPAKFDVTDAVKIGEANLLAVRLYDRGGTSYIDGQSALGGLFNRVVLQARPGVYVTQMLIDSRLERELCEIALNIKNAASEEREIQLSAHVMPDPHQEGIVKGKGRAFAVDLGKRTLAPGVNEFSVEIPMEDAARWSPADPFLYIIQFKAGDEVVGKERFGFRDFKQEGRFLYLNGERVLLFGGPAPVLGGVTALELENKNNIIRKIIIARRNLHQNCFIPRNSMQASVRQMYDICDELGIMLYDWSGRIKPPTSWLYRRYNHPSVVMYALGNETRDAAHVPALEAGYNLVKEHDKQGRPISTVTGAAPKLIQPETDVIDIHLYPGDINGHPLHMGDYIRGYNWDTWRYYGRNLPFITYEHGANYYCAWPDKVEAARELLQNEPVDYRERLTTIIRGEVKDYHMPLGVRWLGLYGFRRYCLDDYDDALARGIEPNKFWNEMACTRQRWVVKLVTEEARRAGDLFQGLGYNWQPYNAFAKVEAGKDPSDPANRSLDKGWGFECADKLIVTTPAYTEYNRVCNPLFICTDVFDKHLFTGGKLNAVVYAINDTVQDSPQWKARVTIMDESGERLADFMAEPGSVPSFKRKLFPFEWDIPGNLPTGIYRMELFLIQDGEVVSDNYYEFFVMNSNELVDEIDTAGKNVSLYDSLSEDKAPGGITTRQILDKLNFSHEQITGFDSLADFDVLIIGSRGVDDVVRAASGRINKWVKDGGRMLVYEQSTRGWRTVSIPFCPQIDYRPGGGIVGDIVASRHPIFEGIKEPFVWDQWNAFPGYGGSSKGSICFARLGPLNRTMLAAATTGTPRSSREATQMLISEIKEGSGIILFSQPEATARYDSDSVATRYLQNTLRYIVSDEMPYAQSIEGFEVVNVDHYRCGYVELDAFAELEPDDLDENTIARAEEGLKDCGGLMFRSADGEIVSIVKALSDLIGGVEFALPESAKLLFPEWEAEKRKVDTDQRGLMPDRMEVVYFLHRVKDAEEREHVGNYLFMYTDGTMAQEVILGGLNISPISANAAISGARYVSDGFYVTRWVNPEPDKPLKSISVEMISDSAELQIGGITAYLIREKVHD